MDRQQTALRIHDIILRFREEHESVWKTPSDVRCLQFALTECAEALDEYIRLDPEWFRTTHRESTIEEVLLEIADCLMMLLSIKEVDEKQLEWLSFVDTMDMAQIDDEFFADLSYRISHGYSYIVAYQKTPFWFVYSAVGVILSIESVNWVELVEKRLERIKGKIHARSQERRESQ